MTDTEKSNQIKKSTFQNMNRFYLCLEKQRQFTGMIHGFDCTRVNDDNLETDPNSFYNTYNHKNQYNNSTGLRNTIIPICKWYPPIFDKYILNMKLKNAYWGGLVDIKTQPFDE